jgi:serpin B
MKTKVAALLSLVLLLAACAPANPTSTPGSSAGPGATPVPTSPPGATASPAADVALARADVPRASAAPEDAAAAGSSIEAFGVDLYREIAAGSTNAVFSPASIALALAMARAGAAGTTATEMDTVMHDLASEEHAAWPNALDQALAGRNGTFPDALGSSLEVALRIANAPFGQRDMPLVPAYLQALAERFDAGLRLVDYKADTEGARRTINAWVGDQTEHRIPELLAPGVLTPASRLTLVNAIYLKAPWLEPFPDTSTAPGSFTRADGSTVEVPLMTNGTFMGYAEGDGWRAVEIPYLGGSLAMTVIVPDDLAAFEAALTADRLDAVFAAIAPTQVTLTLPKFSIETKAELGAVLAALGVPTAFSDAADFSGITTAERLQIADVVHQANIDVDEKGTEAAAATAVVMRASGMPAEPKTVRVDRPFLFALRDLPTGAILFMGRVGDPSITR